MVHASAPIPCANNVVKLFALGTHFCIRKRAQHSSRLWHAEFFSIPESRAEHIHPWCDGSCASGCGYGQSPCDTSKQRRDPTTSPATPATPTRRFVIHIHTVRAPGFSVRLDGSGGCTTLRVSAHLTIAPVSPPKTVIPDTINNPAGVNGSGGSVILYTRIWEQMRTGICHNPFKPKATQTINASPASVPASIHPPQCLAAAIQALPPPSANTRAVAAAWLFQLIRIFTSIPAGCRTSAGGRLTPSRPDRRSIPYPRLCRTAGRVHFANSYQFKFRLWSPPPAQSPAEYSSSEDPASFPSAVAMPVSCRRLGGRKLAGPPLRHSACSAGTRFRFSHLRKLRVIMSAVLSLCNFKSPICNQTQRGARGKKPRSRRRSGLRVRRGHSRTRATPGRRASGCPRTCWSSA